MPTVYDYDDETNVPEIEQDDPRESTFALDGLFIFTIG